MASAERPGSRPGRSSRCSTAAGDPRAERLSPSRLVDTHDLVTAIMVGNDLLAVGAIRAVRQRGMRVPDDVAVTSFDDFDFSELVDPYRTNLRIPGYDAGRSAGELLIDRLEGRPPLQRRRLLPVELCPRRSG